MQPSDLQPDVEILAPAEKWYRKKGCLFILVIFILIFVGLGMFGWQIYTYTQAIKTGNFTPEMKKNLAGILDEKEAEQIVTRDDDPAYGNPDAKIVVIAFEDFQCPICGEEYPILKQVLPDYQDKVLFVYRDFPTGHEFSQLAAEAGNCANEQNKFWEYHDLLYANQTLITEQANFIDLAKKTDMNSENFENCLNSGKYTGEVNKDYMDANLAGVLGTPTFFINGYKIQGPYPVEFWRQVFDGLIKELYK